MAHYMQLGDDGRGQLRELLPTLARRSNRTLSGVDKPRFMMHVLGGLMRNNAADISQAELISDRGVLLCSTQSCDNDFDFTSLTTAEMVNTAQQIASIMAVGAIEEMVVRADSGYLVILPVTCHIFITATLGPNANLGIVMLDLRQATSVIAEELYAG